MFNLIGDSILSKDFATVGAGSKRIAKGKLADESAPYQRKPALDRNSKTLVTTGINTP